MSAATEEWPEAMATVTECKYDAGAGQAMAFGIPLRKHFLIRFNFWANDALQEGEFHHETAIPQATLFPVRYNPADPTDVRRLT